MELKQLGKSGKFSALWIASYNSKKLSKTAIHDFDIESAIAYIYSIRDSISQRLSAYLLFGIVKIYCEKVEVLYRDSNTSLANLNSRSEKDVIFSTTRNKNNKSVNLKENYDISLALDIPDISTTDIEFEMEDLNILNPSAVTLPEIEENLLIEETSSDKEYMGDFDPDFYNTSSQKDIQPDEELEFAQNSPNQFAFGHEELPLNEYPLDGDVKLSEDNNGQDLIDLGNKAMRISTSAKVDKRTSLSAKKLKRFIENVDAIQKDFVANKRRKINLTDQIEDAFLIPCGGMEKNYHDDLITLFSLFFNPNLRIEDKLNELLEMEVPRSFSPQIEFEFEANNYLNTDSLDFPNQSEIEIPLDELPVIHGTRKRKRKSITKQKEKSAIIDNARSSFLLKYLKKKKGKENSSLFSFDDTFGKKSKVIVAKIFYELLVLKSFKFVDLEQPSPVDDIQIALLDLL